MSANHRNFAGNSMAHCLSGKKIISRASSVGLSRIVCCSGNVSPLGSYKIINSFTAKNKECGHSNSSSLRQCTRSASCSLRTELRRDSTQCRNDILHGHFALVWGSSRKNAGYRPLFSAFTLKTTGHNLSRRSSNSMRRPVIALSSQDDSAEAISHETGRNSKSQSTDDMMRNQVAVPFYRPVPFINIVTTLNNLERWKRISLAIVWLITLSTVAWASNVNATGLVDDTEPLFVEAARQMLVTGDFVTPQFNAFPRFDKPPLVYYLMAASMRIFGCHVWAARLPSALCATLLAVAIFATITTFSISLPPQDVIISENEKDSHTIGVYWSAALTASAAFCLNMMVLVWGSTALSDMLLTASVGGALLSLFWNYSRSSKCALPLSAMFTASAILAKGPVGFVLPVGVWFSFLFVTGELREISLISGLKWFISVGVMAAPWFLVMYYLHGSDYISTFFGYHNVERYVQGVNHHGGRPWWYGITVVFLGYFPWSLSLPSSLLRIAPWNANRRMWWKAQSRDKRLPLLSFVWFIFTFSFFALSASQLPSYYLPLAVPLAILTGSRLMEQRGGSLIAAGFYQVLAGLLWLLPSLLSSSPDPKAAEVAALAGSFLLHVKGVVLFGIGGMVATRTQEFVASHPSFLQVTVRGKWSEEESDKYSEKPLLPLWVLHTGIMILFISIFIRPLYICCDMVMQEPLRIISLLAAESKLLGEAVLMVGTRMPSTVFYSKSPVAFVESVAGAVQILEEARSKISSALIITEATLVDKLGTVQVVASVKGYSLLRKILKP